MSITTGQIALGILQLVALSLPVFALLSQIYFRVSDDMPPFLISIVIAIGGGTLVLAGMLSAQYLYMISDSFLIQSSAGLMLLGLGTILLILEQIYDVTKHSFAETREETLKDLDRLIETMEDNGFENTAEFHNSNVELKNETSPTDDLEELRSKKQDLAQSTDHIEKPFKKALEDLNYKSTGVLTFIFIAIMFVSPYEFSSLFDVVLPLFFAYVITESAERLGASSHTPNW